MPVDSSGKYRMNSQIARSPIGGKKAAAAAGADPMAAADPAQGGGEKSVTITQKADGTYSYSDSDGQKQDVPDLQTAMAQAQQCFGDSGDGDQDDQAAAGGAGGSGDMSGGGGGNAGAMGMS